MAAVHLERVSARVGKGRGSRLGSELGRRREMGQEGTKGRRVCLRVELSSATKGGEQSWALAGRKEGRWPVAPPGLLGNWARRVVGEREMGQLGMVEPKKDKEGWWPDLRNGKRKRIFLIYEL